MKRGSELDQGEQRIVLAVFVHRFTLSYRPRWAQALRADYSPYPVQFKDDKDWLEHTYFHVTKKGKLNANKQHCESYPTWPNNPELRRNR